MELDDYLKNHPIDINSDNLTEEESIVLKFINYHINELTRLINQYYSYAEKAEKDLQSKEDSKLLLYNDAFLVILSFSELSTEYESWFDDTSMLRQYCDIDLIDENEFNKFSSIDRYRKLYMEYDNKYNFIHPSNLDIDRGLILHSMFKEDYKE